MPGYWLRAHPSILEERFSMRAPFDPRRRFPAVLAAAAFVATTAIALGPVIAQPATDYQKTTTAGKASPSGTDREVYVTTVHVDGNANTKGDARHPAEPFPSTALPPGGGLSLTAPADDGAWRMRAFVFAPRQVLVTQGTPVTLHFVGVQGPSHRIEVDGNPEIIELKRGQVKTVTVPVEAPGVIGFRSLDRLPSMQGSVVVLPRP
jgi:plastocyanin